jgi:hypothetical protein
MTIVKAILQQMSAVGKPQAKFLETLFATILNQSARDAYTHAAALTRSAAAIRSTAAVTAGAS